MYNTYRITIRQNVLASSDLYEPEEDVWEVYYCKSWYKDIYRWALEYISTMGAHGVITYDLEIVAADIPEYIKEKFPNRIIHL